VGAELELNDSRQPGERTTIISSITRTEGRTIALFITYYHTSMYHQPFGVLGDENQFLFALE
jgi:hypothetical protein